MNEVNTKLMLTAVLTGTFLVPVNSTMISVGLPIIAKDLEIPLTEATWIVTIYLIIMAVTQPISGKLGDQFGNKKVMLTGFILFFFSSIAAALSSGLLLLILFRSLQALGGALATPNATALIRKALPKDQLSRVFGSFGLAMGLGAAIGPLLGSILIEQFGWEAIFWVNIPFLIVSVILSWLFIPKMNKPVEPKKVDYMGSLYLTVFLTLFTLFLTQGQSINVWTLSTVVAAFFLFVRQEQRHPSPIIQFQLFRNEAFTNSNMFIFLNNFVMYSVILFIPIVLKRFNFDLNEIGLLLFGFSLSMSLSSWWGGRLAQKTGRRQVIAFSFGLTAIATSSYFGFHPSVSDVYVFASLLLGGFASGLGVASMQTMNMEAVPKEKAGTASGIYSTFRYMGGMLASALVSLFSGDHVLYILLGIAALFGLLLSVRGTRFSFGVRTEPKS
ncbi:MFS transporter [Halobacillus litoralis]|uniref:MFS transporter n=1 Tax=Halobacillus litoralis TaxID=45668 RepID=UPI00136D417B|nr:MFS transporter [Halobacillus litoralis]MYL36402.1 MFS transporter [Halobacillus litoralis]